MASRRFTDAHDLAHALRDAGVEYVPLRAGPFETTYRVLALRQVLIQRVEDQPHVVRWTVDPGRALLLLPIAMPVPAFIDGQAVDANGGFLALSGPERHGLVSAPVDWAALSLPEERVAELLELGGLPAPGAAGSALLRTPPAAARRLQRAVAEATDLVGSLPPGSAGPELAVALSNSVNDSLFAAFAAAGPQPEIPRATRAAMRILQRAEAYLAANIARPVHTEELCAVLEVSPRSLHKAFVATCGMSPQAYLKRRRLMLVHAALKAEAERPPLVKSVALGHGFWHLGHFARDYRALFGCSPSETAARGRISGARAA